jgi:YgiT-type zinc finger domain-containing protein
MALRYGQCPCGGQYENRSVEVRMTVKGEVFTLAGVPQGACPVCGSRVYKAEILSRVESVMRGESTDRKFWHPII